MNATDPVSLLLSRLRGTKENATGWTAFCPAHDDRHDRSLSISRGDDGRALVHCFAGCEPERIVAAVDLSMADLFPRLLAGWGNGANRRTGEMEGTTTMTSSAPPPHSGLTLPEYAAAKRLDLGRLRSWGLSDAFSIRGGRPSVSRIAMEPATRRLSVFDCGSTRAQTVMAASSG